MKPAVSRMVTAAITSNARRDMVRFAESLKRRGRAAQNLGSTISTRSMIPTAS